MNITGCSMFIAIWYKVNAFFGQKNIFGSDNENSIRRFTNTNYDIIQDDEGPKDEDPETNEKNGRLYDKAGKIRKMKYEQVLRY